jgi:PEGA domain
MDMQKKIAPSWLLLSVFALASSMPAKAAAQTRDPAAAQALFDQGRELSRQGHYAEACPKFLESNRLDPGIGTLFHLAECYQQSGQIATAWATFLDVVSIARAANQLDREKAATKRALQLEPRLPKLVVNVPSANRLQGLEVHRDGSLMGTAQWSTPVPTDPGEHQLTVTAPGYQTFSRSLMLEEGKVLSVEVPQLESDLGTSKDVPPALAVASTRHEPGPAEPKPEPPPAPAADKSSKVDAWPIVLAGAGVVGLAVGTGFAFKAKSSNSDSKQDCDDANPNVCGPTGIDLRNDALKQGNIATVAFISGGALLAAAGVVWVLESKSTNQTSAATAVLRASAAVTPGHASLYLQGNF